MRPACMIVLVCGVLVASAGCQTSSSKETAALMATLPVAGSIGVSRHLAHWVQVDVDAAPVPEAEKADIRARAQILAAHADSLCRSLDMFDETGRTNQSITVENLVIRARALDDEYEMVRREWCTWQVSRGLKKPEEVFEYADVRELIRQ
ncbi:MAG: hypothetical protein KF745_09070 [Phycisphaeraceae bacterium]|nr:hypothetical protein [Phycisphaeraceae bacterium]